MDRRSSEQIEGNEAMPYGGRLMFTQSWEDPACDLEWLKIRPGSTLFAITSGGDNVLEFLLEDPERIVAVDINPLQNHLLELKMAAFRRLSHGEMLNLLGVRRDLDAPSLYRRIRQDLSAAARGYWDTHEEMLRRGLITQGKFERYFAVLRAVFGIFVGRRTIEHLFTLEPDEQRDHFDRKWDTARWRALVRIGCSKWFLGNRMDPSWFDHSDGPPSYGAHFGGLARHVITEIPARSNYFLAQIMLGRYVSESLVPRYLTPGSFETIRDRLDRVQPMTADVCDGLARLGDRSVDAFALSNVFEYSPPALFGESKDQIVRVAREGARVTLRNLVAPRRLSEDARFQVDPDVGARLQAADRGFIYAHFEAARVASPSERGGS